MNSPKVKPAKQGDTRLYLLLVAMVVCTVLYAMWPAHAGGGSESAELIQVLLRENERLRVRGEDQPGPIVATVRAPCPFCGHCRARDPLWRGCSVHGRAEVVA